MPPQRPLPNSFALNPLRTLFISTKVCPSSFPERNYQMTLATDNPRSTNAASSTQTEAAEAAQPKAQAAARCRHFTADGRRCRLAVLDARSHLCFRHSALLAASQPQQNDSEDLSADLLPELSEFNSGVDIKMFLARLLILITKGRISPRRASVLAYVTNQLLHSHRAIARDNHVQAQQEEPIEFDFSHWPGPPDEMA